MDLVQARTLPKAILQGLLSVSALVDVNRTLIEGFRSEHPNLPSILNDTVQIVSGRNDNTSRSIRRILGALIPLMEEDLSELDKNLKDREDDDEDKTDSEDEMIEWTARELELLNRDRQGRNKEPPKPTPEGYARVPSGGVDSDEVKELEREFQANELKERGLDGEPNEHIPNPPEMAMWNPL
uniref:Uncharacterized protein n=2 Tax=Amorphochlora amoebiformis TaxID=1561963 RepID=A0A7S0H3J7_9EUKA|mmetsp:Transcript_26694/g.42354  ORF Transcript_26694/g.42354 Transcript_26694/m.42354 type:complete len:183 (+) Transcript_26694:76-624(+)